LPFLESSSPRRSAIILSQLYLRYPFSSILLDQYDFPAPDMPIKARLTVFVFLSVWGTAGSGIDLRVICEAGISPNQE
jgi:hypothetical protein